MGVWGGYLVRWGQRD
jgi:hypothetical protein